MLMRKRLLLSAILVCCIVTICSISATEITQKNVNDAVNITLRTQITLGTPTIMGKRTSGVKFENNTFIYSNCDISTLNKQDNDKTILYTYISGTATLGNGLLIFDVNLKGGPISSLKFQIELESLKKLKSIDSKSGEMKVYANSKLYVYHFDSFKK